MIEPPIDFSHRNLGANAAYASKTRVLLTDAKKKALSKDLCESTPRECKVFTQEEKYQYCIEQTTKAAYKNPIHKDNIDLLNNAALVLGLSSHLPIVYAITVQHSSCHDTPPKLSIISAAHGYTQQQFFRYCTQLQKYGLLQQIDGLWYTCTIRQSHEFEAKLNALSKKECVDLLALNRVITTKN